jgi:hypothetical protein
VYSKEKFVILKNPKKGDKKMKRLVLFAVAIGLFLTVGIGVSISSKLPIVGKIDSIEIKNETTGGSCDRQGDVYTFYDVHLDGYVYRFSNRDWERVGPLATGQKIKIYLEHDPAGCEANSTRVAVDIL